ncbi:isochorismatase family protein [Curtobacterium sp. Leaf261]|uniref:isochorismatase family protein n=1 Tax=Curtobacterium sp. Leaf261 TaxID=1736311 RepID=UPI0006F5E810|nr:isochorismatase family protein [Curtobacterium sp. Leaf261]KQO65195.1 hydrolase [Curtobacterium sp. Leaf261]
MTIELEQTPALVVVDLQVGVMQYPTAHPKELVVGNAAALATAFRAHGLPVALVNVDGRAPGRTERSKTSGAAAPRAIDPSATAIVPELDQQATDITVTKRTFGAFTGTDLDVQLRAAGATQVVVVGIATSSGVESTARAAHELGYHVALVTDAMSDSAEAHEASVTLQFPKIGEVGTTADVLALLDAR